MSDAGFAEMTQLLQAAQAGGREAAGQLLEKVYDQLRRIAQQHMQGERKSHTLQATALVHESYLRLIGDQEIAWAGRAHFFAAAAEAMRRILIEHARGRGRLKRGGDGQGGRRRQMPLDVVDLANESDPEEILSVEEAVCRLEQRDPDLGRIVRLRFYAGLSEQDVAAALGISDRTVRRDWALAKALLTQDLGGAPLD